MDHVKEAEKYVRGHEPADVHPDVAQAMHRFNTAQEREEGDVSVSAHAESLLDMVRGLGDLNVAPAPDPRYAFLGQSAPVKKTAAKRPAKRPAKKTAAKKAAGSRSRS